jgi:hypothetical protein
MTRLRRLPVRYRLAAVCAGLTFAILALFAVGVAVFSTHQVHSGFDKDLRATAADLQQRLIRPTRRGPNVFNDPRAVHAAASGGGVIWIFLPGKQPISTPNAPSLGNPRIGDISDFGGYRVAARPVLSPGGVTIGSLQYGKPSDDLGHRIARIRLFLLLGLIAGTALAFCGALAVARRTMPPIAA